MKCFIITVKGTLDGLFRTINRTYVTTAETAFDAQTQVEDQLWREKISNQHLAFRTTEIVTLTQVC